MKKTTIGLVLLAILLSLTTFGCQPSAENKDVLFQYSTLGSLMAGVYDGDITYAQLKQHGDFGLGTFNALDGEMVELDHQFYQVKSDGIAYPVAGDMKAPFAVVTYFEPDQSVKVAGPMDCTQLKTYLDDLLPTENIPYAVKVMGTFDKIKTRSVPRQEKPYLPLAEVLKTQPTFDFQAIEGVMLGFRLPAYMEVANAPGYHFHLLTADRKAGGHVLECQVQGVTVEIDYTSEWHTVLPGDEAFYQVDMSDDQYR